jgi:hypothetical protein
MIDQLPPYSTGLNQQPMSHFLNFHDNKAPE